MIRITGGGLGGRRIAVPPSGVRPSQDRLRQGVYSSLGAFVEGARVLDLFAGSGALGLEALSRGAASVCWVERHPKTFAILQRNVRDLSTATPGARLRTVRADAMDPDRYAPHGPFDLVLADPPYGPGTEADLLPRLLVSLGRPGLLAAGAVFVYEQPAAAPIASNPSWELVRERESGDSRWVLYRLRAAAAPDRSA
jgi:16S rRNA (guanine966-N2)-methyltransferase